MTRVASLATRLHFTESLKAYEKAVELQRRKVKQAAARGGVSVAGVAEVIQTRVPAKLLNNAAVLYMRVGRPHKALELLEEALQVRNDTLMPVTAARHRSASHTYDLPCNPVYWVSKTAASRPLPDKFRLPTNFNDISWQCSVSTDLIQLPACCAGRG